MDQVIDRGPAGVERELPGSMGLDLFLFSGQRVRELDFAQGGHLPTITRCKYFENSELSGVFQGKGLYQTLTRNRVKMLMSALARAIEGIRIADRLSLASSLAGLRSRF